MSLENTSYYILNVIFVSSVGSMINKVHGGSKRLIDIQSEKASRMYSICVQ